MNGGRHTRRDSGLSGVSSIAGVSSSSAWSTVQEVEARLSKLEGHPSKRKRSADAGAAVAAAARHTTDGAEIGRLQHLVRKLRSEAEEQRLQQRQAEQQAQSAERQADQRSERLSAQAARATAEERALRERLQDSERRWLDERYELNKRVRDLEEAQRDFEQEVESEPAASIKVAAAPPAF